MAQRNLRHIMEEVYANSDMNFRDGGKENNLYNWIMKISEGSSSEEKVGVLSCIMDI